MAFTEHANDQHPLQKMKSPGRGWSALLHTSGLITSYHCSEYLYLNPIECHGGHFEYLTILGLAVAVLAMVAGLMADITMSPLLFKLKNFLSLTATPLELVIFFIYWGVFAINPRLIYLASRPILPLSVDLCIHLAPILVLGADLLWFSPPYKIKTGAGFALAGFLALSYYVWVEICNYHNGFRPYPMFDETNMLGRIAIFAGAGLLMGLSTMLCKWLYSAVNGHELGFPDFDISFEKDDGRKKSV